MAEDKKYSNIKDLFITIASPPNFKSEVTVTVNKNRCQFSDIRDNIITVKNVFNSKGSYDIKVEGAILQKNVRYRGATVRMEININ